MVLLASGFAEAGVPTDLVVAGDGARPFFDRLSPAVAVIRLPPARRQRLGATVDYLRNARPHALLSAKQDDDGYALQARRVAGVGTRVFVRFGTHVSAQPQMRSWNPLRRWWHHRRLRWILGAADGVICVSAGVAEDLVRVGGVSAERLRVVRNPALTPDLERLAGAPVDHPWFQTGQPPVVLAAGRLAGVKRFDDLVRAFAGVAGAVDCRLVILGEGRERSLLQRLAAGLGVSARVDLPGHVANPLAFMRRAAVFVLSSEREGSPNVLAEALACGTPVVATDCPSGPREILADGRYGTLVPVGDVDALGGAILAVLRDPPAPALLREAVAAHTVSAAVAGYLAAFGVRVRDGGP
jgi:glycosyltransferase involved in cell wall biosynthesis